jgi:NitT/TauT family transport system substrate-binding protein
MGIGVADPKALAQTITIATGTKTLEGATVLTAEPDPAWYTDTYAVAANAALQAMGLNTTGDAFAPITVTLMEGGN